MAHPKLNYDWKRKGDKEILPARYYDDGRALPAVEGGSDARALRAGRKGRESLINYRLQGQFIVVDQMPETLVMRLGKKTAVLINRPTQDADRRDRGALV